MRKRILAAILLAMAALPLAAEFDRGVALYKEQKFREAKEVFRRVLTANVSHLPANAYLAACLYRLEQYPAILDYFPELIQKRTINLNNPDQKQYASILLKHIGFACMQTGQSKRAIVSLSIANKLVSNDPTIYNSLGLAYLRIGKFRLAEISFQTAIHLFPGNSYFHNNLGAAYLELNMYKEALQCFEKSVLLNRNYGTGWDNVWAVRDKMGLPDKRGVRDFSYFTTSTDGIPKQDPPQIDDETKRREERLRREKEARLRKEREERLRKEKEERLRREKDEQERKQREKDRLKLEQEERERKKREEAARLLREEEERRRRAEEARRLAEEERRRRDAARTNTAPRQGTNQ